MAQSGARPQCGFHLLPQRTPRGKHYKANMFTQKRAHAAPPTPFPVASSLRLPSGSPQRNAQARSEPTKSDNRTAIENALPAISTHGGIETYPFASRPVWRVRQTAGVIRTQNAAREPHGRHAPNAKHREKAAPPRRPAPRAQRPCRSCNRQAQTPHRPAIH